MLMDQVTFQKRGLRVPVFGKRQKLFETVVHHEVGSYRENFGAVAQFLAQ